MSIKNDSKKKYYHQPLDKLLNSFNSNPDHGLTSSDLEKKYQEFGYNELPKIKK
ncbi:MAG: cation-transporting P-type ATPase, partial [Promethearchaeota archaeon]